MADIKNIDVFQTVTSVSFEVEPNTNIININKVTSSGGGGATNLSTTQTANNFTINSDTGDDALVPLGNGTLAGATLNDYTTAEKNKLTGIATGAEVNVNADWNATSGKEEILNKPTIPEDSPITIVNDSSLFSTGLVETGDGSNAANSIFLGDGAGFNATGANNSNFLGQNAGKEAGYANNSNFFGFSAGNGATNASYSNFIGYKAGNGATDAYYSNFIGINTGKGAITATNSNFIGYEAGIEATSANNSNFLGTQAGYGATNANSSNFIGISTGKGATNADKSNFFGHNAGKEAISASYSNLFGYNTGSSFTDNNIGANNIIIGTNISLPDGTVDSINLGNVLFGTGTYSDSDPADPSITPTSNGKIGIGVVEPTNTLHIYSEAANTSGLRLERLTSSSPTTAGQAIGVDANGNIVTVTGGSGGGSSVNYYLNGGTSQGTFGGTIYYEFSKTAVIGTGADFSRSSNGYIASFITDVADPSLLLIPAGNWNLEFFFNSSSAGGSPSFYVELYKYDGTTFTSIASSSATPEGITNGTAIDAYFTPLAVPETVLTVNDRLAIRVFVNASSKTITLHTQNGHLCEVITTFTAGLTALNGLQAQVQNFATGTTGTDFAIVSSGSTHTFNLPSASATARGVVTTGSQTFAGDKTFTGAIGASNLSGTNTGDNATNTQYSGLATSKQDTLQSTVNIKSINGNSILGSGDLTISGTGISSLNGLTGATQTFSVFTNFTGSPSFVSTGTNHQLKLPNAGPSTDYGLVTNGSQFIGGTKIFQSNPEIPVPAGNSGSCIVLGTTGGGGATGTLQIGSTTLYPTALEMQYVKGITSSVQTQLDSKASIVANITNDVYSGTIVWTGGAAPTVPNHTYSLSQVGNLVTLTINLAYTTAGSSLLTGVAMELPSTAPAPALPSSATAALDVINYGSGALQILNDSPTTAFATNTLLRIKSTGVYEVFITRGAGQYRHAYATIQYFV